MRSATIAQPVRIEGRGIFSGERCICYVWPWQDGLPAPLTFRLGRQLIAALPPFFAEQPNCTGFSSPEGAAVAVTEHLFAALWAAGIDHALIELSHPELPNHDGSAITLYEAIAPAGRSELGLRPALQLATPLRVESAAGAFIELAGSPVGEDQGEPVSEAPLQISYTFSHPQLGEQRLEIGITRESAVREILPARSFATLEEASALVAAGLLRNRHTEDALLLTPAQPSASADGALPGSYVPSTPLRFGDEFARHKLLDLLGDLYCTGIELSGKVTALRSGHSLNRALASALYALR